MKKIEAVIRRTRFDETKEALLENGVEWFSYVDVRGSGHARTARTGEIGDGRVWVSDIDHYYSIRTGRCDELINKKRSPEQVEADRAAEQAAHDADNGHTKEASGGK